MTLTTFLEDPNSSSRRILLMRDALPLGQRSRDMKSGVKAFLNGNTRAGSSEYTRWVGKG